jgi:large subunit ribosomal protein L18
MISKKDRNAVRKKRHQRIRNKISGTAERPRMKRIQKPEPLMSSL